MSSLQDYLQNALTIDNQESAETLSYQATKKQLEAMGKEQVQQAISALPFSLAEVYHASQRIYQSAVQARNLVTREGGIADTLQKLTQPSDEPFDIGGIASKIVGVGGEAAAAKLAPFAKQYGLNLEAVVQAGKGEGGVRAATAELKGQLGERAEQVTTQLRSDINRGVEQFGGAIKGNIEGIQSDLANQSQEALRGLHQKYSETLKAYSPSDIANLSETSKAQYNQLNDLVSKGEVTPEGVARLKASSDTFARNIGLEQQLKKVTAAKDVLAGRAREATAALEQKSRQLTEQHQAKLSAADEQINRLQAQKEASLDIVKQAQDRLQSRASDLTKGVAVMEEPSSLNRFRSGGSMSIGNQIRTGQSSVDEALVAKHQSIIDGLDSQLSKVQSGREQMVNQFQETLQRETAPYRQTLSELQPAFQQTAAEASTIGSRLGSLVSVAGEGLGVAGGISSIVGAAKGQLQTAGDKVGAGINITAASRSGQGLVQQGIEAFKQTGTEATQKLADTAAEAQKAVENVVSGASKVGEAAGEVAGAAAGEAGAALAGEGEAAAAASALPAAGEVIDIGIGLAAGITALVDIFGGRHDQAPPPPPSQVVSFQHQQGIF